MLDSNPFIALNTLKSMNIGIQDMGWDHFYIQYWSMVDINLYRMYASHCRKNKEPPTISIDSTGNVVKKFDLATGRKINNIFLYKIVINDRKNKSIFSAGNMLLDRRDNHSIAYWLSLWLQNDIPPPKVVVTDQSTALMMAVIKTFTQYNDLATYLTVCWALLQKENVPMDLLLPRCMLQNDVVHIMKLIST